MFQFKIKKFPLGRHNETRLENIIYGIKRHINWFIQRRYLGFDVRDTWSLDTTISKWLLPRLKMFKEVNIVYPIDLTPESWDAILDKIIDSLEKNVNKFDNEYSVEEWKKIQEGFELLGKRLPDLWW